MAEMNTTNDIVRQPRTRHKNPGDQGQGDRSARYKPIQHNWSSHSRNWATERDKKKSCRLRTVNIDRVMDEMETILKQQALAFARMDRGN
jgi:hypothetical protein